MSSLILEVNSLDMKGVVSGKVETLLPLNLTLPLSTPHVQGNFLKISEDMRVWERQTKRKGMKSVKM